MKDLSVKDLSKKDLSETTINLLQKTKCQVKVAVNPAPTRRNEAKPGRKRSHMSWDRPCLPCRPCRPGERAWPRIGLTPPRPCRPCLATAAPRPTAKARPPSPAEANTSECSRTTSSTAKVPTPAPTAPFFQSSVFSSTISGLLSRN